MPGAGIDEKGKGMKHFFIITNSFKDKNLMLTRSMQDYIETKGGRCGYYVSRGEENDSDCIRPEAVTGH